MKHSGQKIKTLSGIYAILGILGNIIGGLVCIFIDTDLAGLGIGIIIGGSFATVFISAIVDGFADIVIYFNSIGNGKIEINDKNNGIIEFKCPCCRKELACNENDLKSKKEIHCLWCNETINTDDIVL